MQEQTISQDGYFNGSGFQIFLFSANQNCQFKKKPFNLNFTNNVTCLSIDTNFAMQSHSKQKPSFFLYVLTSGAVCFPQLIQGWTNRDSAAGKTEQLALFANLSTAVRSSKRKNTFNLPDDDFWDEKSWPYFWIHQIAAYTQVCFWSILNGNSANGINSFSELTLWNCVVIQILFGEEVVDEWHHLVLSWKHKNMHYSWSIVPTWFSHRITRGELHKTTVFLAFRIDWMETLKRQI